MCKLILIGTLWLNPCNITWMQQGENGCVISFLFNGGVANYKHVNQDCKYIAERLNILTYKD